MGDGDYIGCFGDEGEKGDEIVSVVVGLVVENYTWLMWWRVSWRHGFF